MSLGTPVIGSRIGGIPELVSEGETGYLFESKSPDRLKETIQKACSLSPEKYTQMSMTAQRFAREHFSPDAHYRKLLQIYHTTIERYGK
jgi:glycosyltransferase involved in cell wall biosynthesis